MKFLPTREEKIFLLFIVFSVFIFLLVRYYGIEKFRYSIESNRLDESVNFPLDLNSSSFTELLKVPGIGPVLAENIINFRYEKNGFNNINELMDVKGIGEKKLQKLKQYFKL